MTTGTPHAPVPTHQVGILGRVLSLFGQRSIDRIGHGTVMAGRPHVINDGYIEIGDECHLSSHPIQSHLLAMPGARIRIGNNVFISYGTGISALRSIEIGDHVRIGPFCMIIDNDFHKVGDRNSPGLAAPVQIGHHVTIGARVTVMRGARIGDGATIKSGSTVSGIVQNGATVSGVPARIILQR